MTARSIWKRINYELTLNRVERIAENLEPYAAKIHLCPAHVQVTLHNEMRRFGVLRRRVWLLRWIIFVCYCLLYVWAVSAIVGNVVFFGVLLRFLTAVTGVIGSLVLIAVIAVLTRMTAIYVSDAHTSASIIIAHVVKHDSHA